jgi:ribosomal protein L11 methyltransferase
MIKTCPDNQEWIELSVHFSSETKEAVSNFLFDQGAAGLVEGDESLTAYFPPQYDSMDLQKKMREYLSELNEMGLNCAAPVVSTQKIIQKDWNAEWKKHYQMVTVQNRLLIKPSWLDNPVVSPPHVIEIDPQMAFGTGTHATTRLLLEFCVDTIKGGESVLDIGTGTGILAIAAAKLGAADIIAFDVDPIAIETACSNIKKNNVFEHIHLYVGTLHALKNSRFSVIFMNINRIEILKLLPMMSEFLDYKGQILISGILSEEEPLMMPAIQKAGLTMVSIVREQDWSAFKTKKSF